MAAPGFDKRVLPDGATDAGADVLRRAFGTQGGPAYTTNDVIRRHAVAIASTLLSGMIDDGWTITPPTQPPAEGDHP